MGPGKGVKPRLSQTLTRGARPDSNSRPAVQIPNPLPSRYAQTPTPARQIPTETKKGKEKKRTPSMCK